MAPRWTVALQLVHRGISLYDGHRQQGVREARALLGRHLLYHKTGAEHRRRQLVVVERRHSRSVGSLQSYQDGRRRLDLAAGRQLRLCLFFPPLLLLLPRTFLLVPVFLSFSTPPNSPGGTQQSRKPSVTRSHQLPLDSPRAERRPHRPRPPPRKPRARRRPRPSCRVPQRQRPRRSGPRRLYHSRPAAGRAVSPRRRAPRACCAPRGSCIMMGSPGWLRWPSRPRRRSGGRPLTSTRVSWRSLRFFRLPLRGNSRQHSTLREEVDLY